MVNFRNDATKDIRAVKYQLYVADKAFDESKEESVLAAPDNPLKPGKDHWETSATGIEYPQWIRFHLLKIVYTDDTVYAPSGESDSTCDAKWGFTDRRKWTKQ